jgi:hypothetical protein
MYYKKKHLLNLLQLTVLLCIIVMVLAVFFRCSRDTTIVVETSDDCNKIVLDIFFNILQNTDFDADIGPVIRYMSGQPVIDRRQYREGYISTLKDLIMKEDIKHLESMILNKKSAKYASVKRTIASPPLSLTGAMSPFYLAGMERAGNDCDLLLRGLWKEVVAIAAKYKESDSARWTSNSDELEKRIKESPRLQAIILIQQQLKQRPTIEVRVDDNTHQ